MHDHKTNKWVFISLVVGMLLCLLIIAFKDTTSTESLLLSVVLTILSMIGSWLASRYYAELGFNASLRMYALKASEKVNNLSNELGRLAAFLQQNIDDGEPQEPERSLLEREMTIDAAIHIINTLKSVNDRSLSDWKGVIGEELTAQREEQQARQEELYALIDRVQELYSAQLATQKTSDATPASPLQNDLDEVRREIRLLATQVGGVPIKRPASTPKKQKVHVDLPCPGCGNPISYRQRANPNSNKVVNCPKCDLESVSHFNGTGFSLTKRQDIIEAISCPNCSSTITAAVDNFNSPTPVRCEKCGLVGRASREAKGIKVRTVKKPKSPTRVPAPATTTIDNVLLERIKAEMPPQPWPPNTTEAVASRLQIDVGLARAAVRKLIVRGDFYAQIDGRLFIPADTKSQAEVATTTGKLPADVEAN